MSHVRSRPTLGHEAAPPLTPVPGAHLCPRGLASAVLAAWHPQMPVPPSCTRLSSVPYNATHRALWLLDVRG